MADDGETAAAAGAAAAGAPAAGGEERGSAAAAAGPPAEEGFIFAGGPENLLNSERLIKDHEIPDFVKKYVHRDNRGLFDLDILEQTDGDHAVPFHMNWKSTQPNILPRLLYGVGDSGVPMIHGDVIEQRTKKHWTPAFCGIIDKVILEFKEKVDLDLFIIRKDPPNSIMKQIRFDHGRTAYFFCKRCCNTKVGEYTPVVRGAFFCPMEPPFQCSMKLERIYFHDHNCTNKSGIHLHHDKVKLQYEPGYDYIPAPPSSTDMENIRYNAYGEWIEWINSYKQPWLPRPALPPAPVAVVDGDARQVEEIINPGRIGMPPNSSKIDFNLPPENVRDTRSQQSLNDPGLIPIGVNLEYHIRFISWHLYILICRYNLVSEWTPHRPNPKPDKIQRAGRKQEDNDPCTPWTWTDDYPHVENGPESPVHLYMNGAHLIIGGHQLDKNNINKLQAPGKAPYLHQMAHSDFFSPEFKPRPIKKCLPIAASDSPLLRGLSHPFTVNIALETDRSIWMNNITNHVTIDVNATLVNWADTVHGGLNWNVSDPNDITYKPSLHFVIGSVRHPMIPGELSLHVSSDAYCPPEHLAECTKKVLQDELERSHEFSIKICKLLEGKGSLRKNTQLLLTGYQNFTKEQEQLAASEAPNQAVQESDDSVAAVVDASALEACNQAGQESFEPPNQAGQETNDNVPAAVEAANQAGEEVNQETLQEMVGTVAVGTQENLQELVATVAAGTVAIPGEEAVDEGDTPIGKGEKRKASKATKKKGGNKGSRGKKNKTK
jgi:hypothetical protein